MLYVDKADTLQKAGQFLKSGIMYNAAFALPGHRDFENDHYNAACSWALAGYSDSALPHLEIIVYKKRYGAVYRMLADTSLNSLHNYPRWKNLIDTSMTLHKAAKELQAKTPDLFEPMLAARLDTIRQDDQSYRNQLKTTEKKYGRYSEELRQLWKEIEYHDSINLIKVSEILDTRGWLGPEILRGGSGTLFLVIQHSPLDAQLKYLPMMREAAKNNKLSKGSLAMLEDRVALGQGQKQIYGSQVKRDPATGKYFLSPMIDPDNVDSRRAEVGMGSLSDYLSHWDIVWDVTAFKKEIDENEKKKQ